MDAACRRSRGTFFQGGPKCLLDHADSFIVGLWHTLKPVLRETMTGPLPGDYNRLIVLNWATEYPLLWPAKKRFPQPFTKFRAIYLYAVAPADLALFQKMKNPWYWIILGIKLTSFGSVPMFGLQLLLIDKSDEDQLCQYILSFKAYQFLTSVSYAISISISYYFCLRSDGYESGTPYPCLDSQPSSKPNFDILICLEVVRISLLFTAGYMLYFSYGGQGEMRALAEVRLDAADGSMDGFSNTVAIETQGNAADKSVITSAMVKKAIAQARERFKAEPGHGNFLPSFMWYDLSCLFAIVTNAFLWTIPYGHWIGDPVFGDTLYYIKVFYGLSTFPFLVFHLPVVGPSLASPHATGYNTMGLLCPKLGGGQVKRKNLILQQRKESDMHVSKIQRKWRESRSRRWTKLVVSVVDNPFFRPSHMM